MNSIKVRLENYLVGKTLYYKADGMSNAELFDKVKSLAHFHFGSSNIYVTNTETLISSAISYPSYFCAGWLINEMPTERSKIGTQLIVLAHGESMRSAKDKMLAEVNKLDWNIRAEDI